MSCKRIMCVMATIVLFAVPTIGHAQSDILLRLRSGSPAGDRFRVDSAGGVVALGSIGIGIIPASGAGWRMMWYPYKVAFRAGYADAGGQFDDANIGFYSWAGGALSRAGGIYSFAMGNANIVESDAQAGVAIGSGNKIWGTNPQYGNFGVALGLNNDVLDHAGVALGANNWSDGDAAVAIGYTSTADADYSMAFGYRASTNGHTGAKVFGDASTTDSIEAVANNEFAVRAAGGFRFRSNATLTNGCNIAAGGASITCASSKAIKENYQPADGEQILLRMRQVPINYWNIIDEEGKPPHLGPFAEDFFAAFKLGNTDKAIGHQDIDGVNFAAIKALDARTEKQQMAVQKLEVQMQQIQELKAENAELKRRLDQLERLIAERN
jgi:trimeric autotransporter adhesin